MHLIITAGIALFLSSIALHVAIWRLKGPGTITALFIIFFIWPALAVILAALFGAALLALCAIFLLHFSLASAYILSYPVFQAISPSLLMVLMIGSSSIGKDRQEIKRRLNETGLFSARLADLERNGLARQKDGFYALTFKGKALVRSLKALRAILGLPMGRG